MHIVSVLAASRCGYENKMTGVGKEGEGKRGEDGETEEKRMMPNEIQLQRISYDTVI